MTLKYSRFFTYQVHSQKKQVVMILDFTQCGLDSLITSKPS